MPDPARLLSAGDLGLAVGLTVFAALSWCFSVGGCARFARRFGALNTSALGALGHAGAVQTLLREPPQTVDAMLHGLAAEDLFATMLQLRCHRPGAGFPPTRLEGGEHLRAALAEGRGAVLWIGHFVHGALGAKVALHNAGFALSHLSHPRHGFSATRFGMRFLNPLRTRIEDRFLYERVRVGLDSPRAALDVLAERLARNRVVSVTAGNDSRRPVHVPLLHGCAAIAPGAAVLAARTGAALLPVVPVREHDTVVVYVGAPLAGDVAERARACMRWSEPFIRRYRAQWLGWLHLRDARAGAPAARPATVPEC